MPRRPPSSLILITGESLSRCDRVGGRLRERFQRPRPAVDDLALLVDAALRGGEAPPGREVWVLCSDLFSQTVELPAGFALTASQRDVEAALAGEVEGLTGTPAPELALGFRELPGDALAERSYWVTAAPRAQVEAVEAVVRRAGARLGGVLHPGGLPLPLEAGAPAQPWSRLEAWEESTVELAGGNGAGLQVSIAPGRPAGALLPDDHGGAREVLLRSGAVAAPTEGIRRCALDEPPERQAWLERWAQVLAAPAPPVPVVRVSRRGWSNRAVGLVALLVLGAAVLGCWLHQRSIEARLQVAMAELAARQPQEDPAAREVAALEGEGQRLRTQLQELSAALAALEAAKAAHKTRHALLLRRLAQAPDTIELVGIHGTGATLQVEGLADSPAAAAALAAGLAEDLRGAAWRVGSPDVEALGYRLDGGPWRFRLPLQDAPIPPGAPAPVEGAREEGARR